MATVMRAGLRYGLCYCVGHSSTEEELVINVMITFNNLSYYSDGQKEIEKDIARGMQPYPP